MTLTTRHTALLVGLFVAGVGTWYAWTHQGETHNLAAEAAFADTSYWPYSWWVGHGHQGARFFLYPDRTLRNCHPDALASSQGTLSVASSEVGFGG